MNEEIIRKLLQKMADIIADKNGIKIIVNIERKEWKGMINMSKKQKNAIKKTLLEIVNCMSFGLAVGAFYGMWILK